MLVSLKYLNSINFFYLRIFISRISLWNKKIENFFKDLFWNAMFLIILIFYYWQLIMRYLLLIISACFRRKRKSPNELFRTHSTNFFAHDYVMNITGFLFCSWMRVYAKTLHGSYNIQLSFRRITAKGNTRPIYVYSRMQIPV